MFRVKCHSDGSIDLYKAQSVAKWYSHDEGIGFLKHLVSDVNFGFLDCKKYLHIFKSKY